MVAAYREYTLGRGVYLADISSMRDHVGAVAARGNDRHSSFRRGERPTADDRVIVYQKGALVLHELRELIGDTAFWSGSAATRWPTSARPSPPPTCGTPWNRPAQRT
jgi:hypothetical protein